MLQIVNDNLKCSRLITTTRNVADYLRQLEILQINYDNVNFAD